MSSHKKSSVRGKTRWAKARGQSASPSSRSRLRPPSVRSFPIAGIGASAGGLEALESFFTRVPPDSGVAFVVVTHLHPGHASLLPELLARYTRMPIQPAVDGLQIVPDTIYMSQPGGTLAILQGRLYFMAPDECGSSQLPIDCFFRSLAEDQKEKAVGIILSGTGTDGTEGLKAIKDAGGMTMAQRPDTAKFSGMPASAVAAGLADHVLPAEQLPARLAVHARRARWNEIGSERAKDEELSGPMQKILIQLRTRAGQDFSLYKANTLRRRIERRIQVHSLTGPEAYLRLLRENPHEVDLLLRELLIGVTQFFRDREAFDALAKTVIPKLLADRPAGDVVRVWVAGCSTGEEAYSLAILLREAVDKRKQSFPVQIFGTDLENAAIEFARRGFYPQDIAREVGPRRLARFFLREAGGYRIKPEIRKLVIFAKQNVLQDPPFTRLDIAACRNLLIYLQPAAQNRLLSLMHHALKPGGVLFLGTSESVTGLEEQFTVMNKKMKLFTRSATQSGRALPAVFLPAAAHSGVASLQPAARADAQQQRPLAAMVEKTLLTRYAPASVIVNDRGDILHIHGRTGDYLEPATGQPRLNLLEMAREGLRIELPAMLRQAIGHKAEVVREGIRVKMNGGFGRMRLTVSRLADPEAMRGLLLVTFQPEPAGKMAPGAKGTRRAAGPPARPARVTELERELRHTREMLQHTVGELQTANEDLKTSNEELQSANEELQSTNEELETSKEEMQSLNEELQTVNAELKTKLDTLAQTSDDMQNLLNSTAIATLFLDHQLRIKRFTAEATKLFKLLPSDIGRPIGDLTSSLNYDQLAGDARKVLQNLGLQEKEVQTRDGGWWQVRIHPYRTTANVIEGLIVTFVDIHRLKLAELALQQARADAESIVATVRQPLLVLDEKLRVVLANRGFHLAFKTTPREVEQRLIYEVGKGQWNQPALRHLLERVLPRKKAFEDFELEQGGTGGARKIMRLSGRQLRRAAGAAKMILLAVEDITPGRARARKADRRPQ